MKWLFSVAALVAGCSVDVDYKRTTIPFDPVSPGAPGGTGEPIAANGSLLYVAGSISKDGGATWAGSHPAIQPETARYKAWSETQLVVQTTQFGWGRWTMTTDLVESINQPQNFLMQYVAPDGTIFGPISGSATIARQTANGTWSQSTLPMPQGAFPTVYDIVATGSTVFLSADWGIYRSDDGGATWVFLYDPGIHVKLLALPDGRVALIGQANNIVEVLEANGATTGITSPQFPSSQFPQEPFVCLGAIVSNGQYSTDLGQSWSPVLPAIPGITWGNARTACGSSYLLVSVAEPTRWLIHMTTLGELGSLYSFVPDLQGGTLGGDGMLRTASGTILASDLAWREGEATWSLRPLPRNHNLVALADGSLWGYSGRNVTRSTDDGVTFTTTEASADLPPFETGRVFAESNGTMWGGTGMTTQAIYRSDDHGLTWQQVPGTGKLLAGVARDGTLVATSGVEGFHVSHDRGVSWTDAPFPMGYRFRWLTVKNHGVTFDANDVQFDDPDNPGDPTTRVPSFHVWEDYGAGLAIEQASPLVPTPDMGDQQADLTPVLSSVVIDESSTVWWYGGSAVKAVWRSRRAID